MATSHDHRPQAGHPAPPQPGAPVATEGHADAAVPTAEPGQPSARPLDAPSPPPPARPAHMRKLLAWGAAAIALALVAYFSIPWFVLMLNTVSTDDAYVNGHVTFVAPRVPGQVVSVLVDDNMRVKAGDVLVRLDQEPYQVQVNIKQAAVVAAETDLVAANAQVRGLVAVARSNRFKLAHAIEDVNNQIANLKAAVATVASKKANLELANDNLRRGERLLTSQSISREEFDQRREIARVADAALEESLQRVYAIRVGLGLPALSPAGKRLTEVPADLDQNFSTVRQVLAELIQSAAQLGFFPTSWTAGPKQVVVAFYKQDPQGDLDRIYAHLIPNAPVVKQAEAKLLQARRDLDQAKLNLRYCDILSEIDGVVSRRNVNPGNNVIAGQSLLAVRSLTEIWIDANFKETQLADLRIGQRAKIEVDMYGTRREFEGRITGFTMGTGQTLALLPPQNATGNFVKIVQRLPVRIELTDYDPSQAPLFVGLSVTPYVYYREPAEGPHAGEFLQPLTPLPTLPKESETRSTKSEASLPH